MTERAISSLKSAIYPLLVLTVWITLTVPCPGQAGAAATPTSSSPANAPYVATMTFDVASVRENKDIDLNAGITVSGHFVPHTTTLRVTNWSIENLISYAYGVDLYQIVGRPEVAVADGVCDRGQG